MIAVSRETKERLDVFVDLLNRWNRHINLIAKSDEGHIWERHIWDSAQLAPLFKPLAGNAVDLGSGAGFPGLILAIITGQHFHLVESDQRKAAFLREAARLTATPVTVHASRAEHIRLPRVRLVTARGLATLSNLLDLAAPLLAPDGNCLFLKGRGVEAELTDAAREWHMRMTRTVSMTDPTASILHISEISRVGSPT